MCGLTKISNFAALIIREMKKIILIIALMLGAASVQAQDIFSLGQMLKNLMPDTTATEQGILGSLLRQVVGDSLLTTPEVYGKLLDHIGGDETIEAKARINKIEDKQIFYVIHATINDKPHLIISQKKDGGEGKTIKEGKKYKLFLKTVLPAKFSLLQNFDLGDLLSDEDRQYINGNDIYRAVNLQGLVLTKDN